MNDTAVSPSKIDKPEKVKRYIYLTTENHELCTRIADKIGMKIHELEGMIFKEGMKSAKFSEYRKLADI